jgi:thioredoxin 1
MGDHRGDEPKARVLDFESQVTNSELEDGSTVASLTALGLEARGVNSDDARAALQRVFLDFLRDPGNADVVASFFAAHAVEEKMPELSDAEKERRSAEAAEAQSAFAVLSDDSFDAWVAGRTVLIDFTADWCGPCRTLAPVLRAVAERLGLSVGRVDADQCPRLVERFRVMALPTVLLLRDGTEVERLVGAARGAAQMETALKERL